MSQHAKIALVIPIDRRTRPVLEIISDHQHRALRCALKAILDSEAPSRRAILVAVAARLETPVGSLARRLIDMAPLRDRAQLRDDLT